MPSVIGLKKCPKCGLKQLYGCHNYYTTGAPFKCPNCGDEMLYAPYKTTNEYLSDEEWEATWNLLDKNLKTLDFEIIEHGQGRVTIEWLGIKP